MIIMKVKGSIRLFTSVSFQFIKRVLDHVTREV